MKVVLLGGNGFLAKQVGSYLENQLTLEVLYVSRTAIERANYVRCDLSNKPEVVELLSSVQPDVVVNMAGVVAGTERELFLANTVLPVVVAESIKIRSPHTRFVHIGSAAEYGFVSEGAIISEDTECNPVSVYGHSKLAATRYLLSKNVQRNAQICVLRLFNVVGKINSPNQFVGAFVQRVVAARASGATVVKMGPLNAIRDFVTLGDFQSLVYKLLLNHPSSNLVNVCSGVGRQVRGVIDYLSHALGDIGVEEVSGAGSVNASDSIVGNPHVFLHLLGKSTATPIEIEMDSIWECVEWK